ncbi:MAG: nitrilase-related carbon-nitrogen hydrolase [Armatimonadota bacterium]|nr:nitrilase-related carbon-nitrogen hydrolase [Armatimonadota bacterium]
MRGRIRVAAVQLEARRYRDPEEYFRGMSAVLDQAGEVDLVVFPAYTGLMLLEAVVREPLTLDRSLVGHVEAWGQELLQLFREGWGSLAKARGLFLVAGTVPILKEGRYFHAAVLLAPDGGVVGTQPQTHLLPWEREIGWSAGTELHTFPTEVGPLGILVNTDTWYPEVSRILSLQGAALLLAVNAVPKPYAYWHQVRGLWQEVQQNQVFGVESGLVGSAFGREFEGRTAAFGPCEATPGETGWMGTLEDPTHPGVLTVELSYARLQEVIDQYSVFAQFHYGLYDRFLPSIYFLGAPPEAG